MSSNEDITPLLLRIHEILARQPGHHADWLHTVIAMDKTDSRDFYRALNSKRMWGGAGSVANQALADNPGIDPLAWAAQIREFRELMIELGQRLQSRGDAYPDISSWLLAFSNWNQSQL